MSAHMNINLASRPFKPERARNAGYLVLSLALILSLFVLLGLLARNRAEASTIRAQIDHENTELAGLQRQSRNYGSILARPANTDVFSMSVFLNQLIARRAISWARVFGDLATVLPPNMRVEVVRLPQTGAEEQNGVNHVQLDMIIGSDRADSVLMLLNRLRASSLFGSASVINQAPPTQNDPFFKFRVTVSYAQKL